MQVLLIPQIASLSFKGLAACYIDGDQDHVYNDVSGNLEFLSYNNEHIPEQQVHGAKLPSLFLCSTFVTYSQVMPRLKGNLLAM